MSSQLSQISALDHTRNEKNSHVFVERLRDTFLRRRTALLGGTTTLTDCLIAMGYLVNFKALVQGPAIEKYQKAFAERIGVRYGCSFSAGRVGLYALLKILGIGPEDEVLLQAPTHIVVANAIRYLGAKPVYVDCNLHNFNMDLVLARKKITSRTKAIILQHTFGIPLDMDAALNLSNDFGIPIIEDCVHALGARYDGKPVGSFGKAAFFSSEETKTISTTMGGMVVTDDEEIADKLYAFQQNCSRPSAWLAFRYILKLVLYHVLMQPHFHRFTRTVYERLGNRHPLPRPTHEDELRGGRPEHFEQLLANAQAALGTRQLQRLDSNLRHRAQIAECYRNYLAKLGFKVPEPPPKAEAAYVRYPIWIEDRQAAVKKFAPYLVLGTWFTSVLEEALSPACGGYQAGSCPNAESAAKHLINLPTHPRVGAKDVEKFITTLKSFNARFDKHA